MAGYLLLKLNKGKNSYGFLGIRNNELYTDYNINDGAKFYSFEEAKPYINRLVKAGFEVRLWGTGDFSKDNSKFGQNPFTKIIKENKNMQEKIKKLSESIKERVLEKRLGKSEIQENSYHAEEHEGKWVIKDEAGYIMTTDKFDTKEEAEADIAKHGQPKEQALPVENARVKRVEESKINEGNYDYDNAWLGFCTNVKRYSTGEEVSIEDAIEAELDDLVYTSDIINIWKDMPGNLGSRINEITDLMRQDIQEGAYDDIDFISNLDESKKMNENIIDVILDRQDDDTVWTEDGPVPYSPEAFYRAIADYGEVGWGITRAMDNGTEEDVKAALKQYLADNGYASEIGEYIDSVNWLNESVNENQDVYAELERISKAIENEEDISYGELFFLQNHKKEIREMGDIRLAEFAGIPENEWNENHKARKSMKKSVNEDNNLQQIFDDAFSGGTIPAFETANGVMYLEPKDNKIIIGGATNTGVIPQYEFEYDFSQSFDWNIQGMIEQVYEQEGYPENEWNENYKGKRTMKKSVNEISDELASKVTGARRRELKNADRAFAKARTKAWKDTEGMDPADRFNAIIGDKKLDKAENRARKAGRKLGNNITLNKLRNNRKAQNESLAETLLREAHSVLTMNENESSELTTWQFTARGFSKAMIEKQSVFGSANIRCIIHENADGKVVGTAVADYYMDEVQVEEAIKKALAENGFKATSITDLVNLY